MNPILVAALCAGCLLAGHHAPIAAGRWRQRRRNAAYMADLVARSHAPAGYGDIIRPAGKGRPGWLGAEELVVRHLPGGPSERKAGYVTTWDHPFRLRADHPHYASA